MQPKSLLVVLPLSLPLLVLPLKWRSITEARTAAAADVHASHISAPLQPTVKVQAIKTAIGQVSKASYPLAIDGAQTPDRIPDRIAYYHFLMASAIPSGSSDEQVARRERMFTTIGLPKADRTAS